MVSLQQNDRPASIQLGSVLLAFLMGAMVSHHMSPPVITSTSESYRVLKEEINVKMTTSAPKPSSSLLTLGEMKERWRLPCNYVHDGHYLQDSNRVLYQVYKTLTNETLLEDDDIPVMVEVGGHDGITKSISLKTSVCLNVNTLLIEATPSTFKTLKSARAYDLTVNAALCEEEFISMVENERNSGENKVSTSTSSANSISVPCTTIDEELDKLIQVHNVANPGKVKLVFLVLDVEGYEHVAIRGLQKYSPMKAMMEVKFNNGKQQAQFDAWFAKHNMTITKCSDADHQQDQCFNYDTPMEGSMQMEQTKKLLYGARNGHFHTSFRTQDVAPHYLYYGQ